MPVCLSKFKTVLRLHKFLKIYLRNNIRKVSKLNVFYDVKCIIRYYLIAIIWVKIIEHDCNKKY